MGTPRQRGDCGTVSGLSLTPGAVPKGKPAPAPRPAAPPPGNARLPARAAAEALAARVGIFPSGGSMIIDVRLPVFKTELNTALYAPLTSCAASVERVLRPGLTPFFSSAAATSASVRNSLPAFAADRSSGTS